MQSTCPIMTPGTWINDVCCFLTLEDITSFALTCKVVNCIKLDSATVHKLVEKHPIASKVDTQFIDFYDPTLASLRKNLFHVIVGSPLSTEMQIDPRGRRMIDRSFSLKSVDSSEALDKFDEEEEEEEGAFIEKHLESASFDEYDDFNPRHPEYKANRGHRRGGSYFNSDISDIVDMIHQDDPSTTGVKGMDNMAMLAQMALDSLDIDGS
mmetsp:Transcript_8761/g.14909  ORF Transcript_8761/g.14909 Transcript_8761/m.14909 type:complete len:210 (+) Transcript_8761:119-748(+)